nr:hypothetical protein PB20LOC_03841 [Pectobacterium parmentieri]
MLTLFPMSITNGLPVTGLSTLAVTVIIPPSVTSLAELRVMVVESLLSPTTVVVVLVVSRLV